MTPATTARDERLVFLVHAAADAAWVEGYLIPALGVPREQLLLVEDFRLGAMTVAEVERAVARCRYTLLVLSAAFVRDHWATYGAALARALDVAETSETPRLIPLYRDADARDQVAPGLRALVSLDCTDQDPAAWDAELARLRRTLELADKPAPAADPACPYPGMIPFTAADAGRFFGREADTQALVTRVLAPEPRAAFIVGPSGSGKSSLVHAGLVPRLPKTWLVREVRPGAHPVAALYQALGAPDARTAAPLAPLVAELLARAAAAAPCEHVLVFVDPLEDLFTQVEDPAEQQRFCDLVAELLAEPRCTPLFAVRADFYAELMSSPLWPHAEHRLVPVAPLAGDALRQAITRPARQQGVYLEPALVERLVEDAAREPGALPLLQETLRVLWRRRAERGLRAYLPLSLYHDGPAHERGTLAETLEREAQETMARLQPGQRDLAWRVLLRLVQFGQGRPHTRRQQRLADFVDQGDDLQSVTHVVHALAARRLLTLSSSPAPAPAPDIHAAAASDAPGAPEPLVDLAHEALIRAWPAYDERIRRQRASEEKRRAFQDRAERWQHRGKRGDLLDAVMLADARAWRAEASQTGVGCSPLVADFIHASERAVQQEHQRWQLMAGIMVVLHRQSEGARQQAERYRAQAVGTIRESARLAEYIVYTSDRELEPIAGVAAAAARRQLMGAAAQLLDRLRQAVPEDTDGKRNRSTLHTQRGDLALSHDDLAVARAEYQAALALDEELAATDPGNALWQNDLSVSLIKLGDLETRAGNLEQARVYFTRSLGIHEAQAQAQADPQNAGWQRDLSGSLINLGDLETRAGNLEQARASFTRSLGIIEALALADPQNAGWQRDLSVSLEKLGDLETRAGNLEQARAYFTRSLGIREALAQADPQNAGWQRDLSVSLNKLGDLETRAGNLEQARAHFVRALEIHQALAQADPSNAGWQRDLIVPEMRLALLDAQAGRMADARAHVRAAREVLARLDAMGLLRGDALLEQYRAVVDAFEAELPAAADAR